MTSIRCTGEYRFGGEHDKCNIIFVEPSSQKTPNDQEIYIGLGESCAVLKPTEAIELINGILFSLGLKETIVAKPSAIQGVRLT